MDIIETGFEGLVVMKPKIFRDERGYFFESFSQKKFKEKVGSTVFVQDNESHSKYGVLRGLHYQKYPFAQAKLVRVISGKILDVAVDIRKDSATFGKHFSIEISDENKLQIFIPHGFAHGFIVLSETAIFQYKCDNYYEPNSAEGIKWDDEQLKIDWRLPQKEIILSEKDKDNKSFNEIIYM